MKSAIYSLIIISGMALTLASCGKDSGASSSEAASNSNTGVGGSKARFAVIGNTLFTVDHSSLNIYDISNSAKITKLAKANLGRNIETIFPRDSKSIFIGSQEGMYIYDVSNPVLPSQKAFVSHIRACDPVVADNNYAYVTLSTNPSPGRCNGNNNTLWVYDISNLNTVSSVRSYNMTNPQGLGLNKNNLFVCDNGVRWYDATNPASLVLKGHYTTVPADDVIVLDSLLMLVSPQGLTQMRYKNDSIYYLSTMYVSSSK